MALAQTQNAGENYISVLPCAVQPRVKEYDATRSKFLDSEGPSESPVSGRLRLGALFGMLLSVAHDKPSIEWMNKPADANDESHTPP